MTHIDRGVIRKGSQSLVQSLVHLGSRALEKPTTTWGAKLVSKNKPPPEEPPKLTTVEQGVTSEDDLLVAILHVPADRVLGVARGVEALHLDVAQLEAVAIGWRGCHTFTLLTAVYGQLAELRKLPQVNISSFQEARRGSTRTDHLFVAPCMVPVAAKQCQGQ